MKLGALTTSNHSWLRAHWVASRWGQPPCPCLSGTPSFTKTCIPFSHNHTSPNSMRRPKWTNRLSSSWASCWWRQKWRDWARYCPNKGRRGQKVYIVNWNKTGRKELKSKIASSRKTPSAKTSRKSSPSSKISKRRSSFTWLKSTLKFKNCNASQVIMRNLLRNTSENLRKRSRQRMIWLKIEPIQETSSTLVEKVRTWTRIFNVWSTSSIVLRKSRLLSQLPRSYPHRGAMENLCSKLIMKKLWILSLSW